MPYVRRDPTGTVISLHRAAEGGASEWLDDTDTQVQAFVQRARDDAFQQLDADFIRVLEDLINVLVDKHVLNITDLPEAAREKLAARRDHRRPTALAGLNLLGDAPDVGASAAVRQFSALPLTDL